MNARAASKLTGSPRLSAWLELCRVSNLPTVWTNVLAGVALGWVASRPATPLIISELLNHALWLLVSASLLYSGGMVLNDVMDAGVDAEERPSRPIPSGRLSRRDAAAGAVAMLLAGWGFLLYFPVQTWFFGAALLAVIVGYDALHKRFPVASLLMGACRGLLYLTAASTVTGMGELGPAAMMAVIATFYTILLTIAASREATTGSGHPREVALVLVATPAILWGCVAPWRPVHWPLAGVLTAGALAWLLWAFRHAWAKPPQLKSAILAWLAAMCLFDAIILAILGLPAAAGVAVMLFVLTKLLHRVILGT